MRDESQPIAPSAGPDRAADQDAESKNDKPEPGDHEPGDKSKREPAKATAAAQDLADGGRAAPAADDQGTQPSDE